MPLRRYASIVMQQALYRIERIFTCDQRYYLWLRLRCTELSTDIYGAWVANVQLDESWLEKLTSHRLVSLNNSTDVTCVHAVPTDAYCRGVSLSVIPKM